MPLLQQIFRIAVIVGSLAAWAAAQPVAQLEEDLSRDMERYYSLVEHSLEHRIEIARFYNRFEDYLDENGFLKAEYVHGIKQKTKEYLATRQAMYDIILKRESWVDDDSIPETLRLKGVMLSLSGAIVLYDNYAFALADYQHNTHLRKIIDSEDTAYDVGDANLRRLSYSYNSLINRYRVQQAVNYYQEHRGDINPRDDGMRYLQQLIDQSPSYKSFNDDRFLKTLASKLKLYRETTTDSLGKATDTGMNTISLLFGNAVGLVSFRHGKMYDNPAREREVASTLKAGDILLEKTPFRLTDTLIPGYWGHAAIWVGTKEELVALGIWEHALVRPHHRAIENGHHVIEALRSGVEINPLSQFMNIDDLAVLRETHIGDADLKQVLLRAFGQIGKSYDFNFDVETTDKIVCSELVYTTYTHLQWPTDKTLGRYTVSPDNIAAKTQDATLDIIALYHNGDRVRETKPMWELMLAEKVD